MAIKKSELYSSLWASCDELRGGMDASQYKDYVLTMLFVKYGRVMSPMLLFELSHQCLYGSSKLPIKYLYPFMFFALETRFQIMA